MLDVTACIVTYNNPADLINRAIASFLNSDLSIKIFISDNSETSTLQNLIIEDDRIEYQFNNANLGFGAAHNLIIDKILDLSKFHVILNPDVEYSDSQLLNKFIRFASENNEFGSAMPKVIYPDGETQLLAKLLPSPGDLISRRFLPFLANKNFDLQFSGYNKTMEVPFITGCYMFVKTNVLKEVGGFDDRYFMYCEDIDLSRRIHSKYKTYFLPEVEIVHHYAKDSYKTKALLKIHIASAVKYFNKWGWFIDAFRKKANQEALSKIR
jgi:GT2 family glycosyltransferase